MEKGSRELSNQFYLVFDFDDNDLAGIVRAINKGFLPRYFFWLESILVFPQKY